MARLRRLTRYQKFLLLFMAAMILVFSVLYPITLSRTGFSYRGSILVPREEGGRTIYEGKVRWTPAVFTVEADKTVTYQFGDTTYGPYTARRDPTALPDDPDLPGMLTGVELRRGEEIIFRGGVTDRPLILFHQDGATENERFYALTTPSDPVAPSALTILMLMSGPELTHNGTGLAWFLGILFCLATAVSMLYADELFRWRLSFQVRDTEAAEPSEWEIFSRYASWTLVPLLALIFMIIGLK